MSSNRQLRLRKEKQGPPDSDPMILKRKISGPDTEPTALKKHASTTPYLGPVTVRKMELRDAAAVFHIGEKEYSSFQQLYRTWDEYEVCSWVLGHEFLFLWVISLSEDLLE